MTTLPAAGYISDNARTEAQIKQALEDVRSVIAQQPGASPTTELTIATGAVTPTTGIHTIDTEADAATDDLDTIVQTNLPDGSLLWIAASDASRTVVVKHNIGGTGKIVLVDAANLSLIGVAVDLLLIRRGTQWNEVARFYAPNAVKTLASAATTALGSTVSTVISVTGVATITSFGTSAAGTWRFVTFTGALILTHNATVLKLPGSANITTAANDSLLAVSDGGGNWRVVSYQKASGKAVITSIALGDIANDLITYAKIQNISAASRLLGRGSAGGAGDAEEISIGAGLSMSGTTLSSAVATKAALYQDQKADGTDGGGTTAGSWLNRVLNTEVFDTIGATLSANQVTLPAGTYIFSGNGSFYTRKAQHRIFNVTDSTVVAVGPASDVGISGLMHTPSVFGVVTIASSKAFALQYRVDTGRATDGFGQATPWTGEVEVYASLLITQVS